MFERDTCAFRSRPASETRSELAVPEDTSANFGSITSDLQCWKPFTLAALTCLHPILVLDVFAEHVSLEDMESSGPHKKSRWRSDRILPQIRTLLCQ